MMKFGALDVISPMLSSGSTAGAEDYHTSWTEAEVLGASVWLWMHSNKHREIPLQVLSTLLLPAIKLQQFILISEHGKPVFYLSWANMSATAEARYIENPSFSMPQDDWNSGDRMWILDWVAPFGHTQSISKLIKRHLLADRCMRSLYHRGDEKGLRVINFHGIGVMPELANYWFKSHPLISSLGQGVTML
jgi:cytolysin-activating lysine-acyltransferase